MTIPQRVYVPILKCKQNEKGALRQLAATARSSLTPLIEVVERKGDDAKPLDNHLRTAFRDLSDALGGDECWLDTHEIPGCAARAFECAGQHGVKFLPVIWLRGQQQDLAAALQCRAKGLCLRVSQSDLRLGVSASEVRALLEEHHLAPAGMELVLDMGAIEELAFEGGRRLVDALLHAVPPLREWRSVTLAGTALPASMKDVPTEGRRDFARTEWVLWRDYARVRAQELGQFIAFGDCAIQHPRGVEGYDPRVMPRSPTIRFALSDQWLIWKGKSNKLEREALQFPRLADAALRDLGDQFHADHCGGCGDLRRASIGAPRLGSAGIWRRIGTVHHMTTVVEQLHAFTDN